MEFGSTSIQRQQTPWWNEIFTPALSSDRSCLSSPISQSSPLDHTSYSCMARFSQLLKHQALSPPWHTHCKLCCNQGPAASLLAQQPVSSTMKGREAKMHTLLRLQQWKHFPPPPKILRILAPSRTCTGALPGRTPPLEFCTSFSGPPTSLRPSFLFDFNLQPQLSQGTSQVVQCSGLCLPRQGVWIQSLDGELRSRVPQGQKKAQNIKKKWDHNNFNKDFKNDPHQRTLKNIFLTSPGFRAGQGALSSLKWQGNIVPGTYSNPYPYSDVVLGEKQSCVLPYKRPIHMLLRFRHIP